MRHKDYIPRKDRDYLVWITRFLKVLLGILERVEFPKAVYDKLVELKDDFAAKLAECEVKQTRNAEKTFRKNAAREKLTKYLRPNAKVHLIYNAAVTNDDKVALGLNVPSETSEPAHIEYPAPDSKVRVVNPREVVIDFFPKGQKKGAAKPEDQHEAEILYCVGPKEATSMKELTEHASSTASPIRLVFTDEQRGKICSYVIRWVNVVGQPGGWSEIRYFYVP
jgi:hypothetical protein